MESVGHVFLLLVLGFLTQEASVTAAREYKYVNEGENVTLRCSTENISLASWYGPTQSSHLNPYFNGQMRNHDLSDSVSIQVSTDTGNGYEWYNLVIGNISTEMKGDYRCQRSQNNSEMLVYTVVFMEDPSVIDIVYNGRKNPKQIHEIENTSVELACRIEQDISVLNMSWYNDGSCVKSGDSNTLNWSFHPTRTDNNRTITCVVYISQLEIALSKSVVMDIEYNPVATFETNPKQLLEGRSFEISCYGDGNPPVELVHIKKGKDSLKICNGPSCSYGLNGTLQDSNTYTCLVFSRLTKDPVIVTQSFNVLSLEILYNEHEYKDNERINGTENESIEIVCRLNDNISAINISWYKDGSIVKSGQTNTLTWSFVPTRTDNNKTISCEVFISQLETSLLKSVFLDIRRFPVAILTTNPQEIIEGYGFEISCNGDGNPPVELVFIKKGKDFIAKCSKSSCSYRLNGTRQDSGTYTCYVSSSITKNESTTTTTVNVLYPPDVTVNHHDNSLHCNAKGNPNNISFVAWQHYTEFGELIRTFEGSQIIHLNISYKRYMANGIYSCEATNGIPDVSGNKMRLGSFSLETYGMPEILPNTQMVQYGKYNDVLSVVIFVYSLSPITTTGVTNINNNNNIMNTQDTTVVSDNFTIIIFTQQVVMKGYEIRFQTNKRRVTKTDFGNYTFSIANSRAEVACTIVLQEIDAKSPSPPLINAASSIDSDILVSFQQTANEEHVEQLVVEYRKVYEDTWTFAYTINNSLTEPYSVTIYGLEYGVEYCVQVYGINDAGRGNSTEVCSIKTANNLTYMYTLIALPAGIIFLCVYFGFRKRKTIQSWILGLRRAPGSHVGDAQNEQELHDSPPLDSTPLAHNDMHAMPNRNLEYIELDLNENTGRFYIRGEERTNYSDIEYFRVGPPASSSSSEDGDDDRNKDNDDFMSLEEIADMVKGRGAYALPDCQID